MIFFGTFWQSPLKLCQSLKIFCNSSPQVVELSLFLFHQENLLAFHSTTWDGQMKGGQRFDKQKLYLLKSTRQIFPFYIARKNPSSRRNWLKKLLALMKEARRQRRGWVEHPPFFAHLPFIYLSSSPFPIEPEASRLPALISYRRTRMTRIFFFRWGAVPCAQLFWVISIFQLCHYRPTKAW